MPYVASGANTTAALGYPDSALEYLLNGSPSGMFRENFPRISARSNSAAIGASGVMASYAIPLFAGEVVTNISFRSGSQAAVTPTNWWFALYSNAATPALLAQTADQTSTAWAANTVKTLALSAAQTITTTGVYFVSIMMAAGTVINITGQSLGNNNVSGAVVGSQAILARTSGSGLTTTAPGTIASASNTADVAYCVVT